MRPRPDTCEPTSHKKQMRVNLILQQFPASKQKNMNKWSGEGEERRGERNIAAESIPETGIIKQWNTSSILANQ